MSKQKLELTWVGKDVRPRLEPRVLLEDPTKSYTAAHRVGDNDLFENKLIFGDNLLALKALEQELTGQVKCIFIDPPYNTGSAFEHYDDGLEHSLWLSMMRDRLELLKTMLRDDGSIWITIDDSEAHYLKVTCDEIYGRNNFVASFLWRKVDSPNDNKVSITPDHEYVFCYAKSIEKIKLKRKSDPLIAEAYGSIDESGRRYRDRLLKKNGKNSRREDRPTMYFPILGPDGIDVLPIHDDGSPARWAAGKEKIFELLEKNEIIWKLRFVAGEERWTPYTREYALDNPERPYPTIWNDLTTMRQAKAHQKTFLPEGFFFDTPKPEELISRILEIATNPSDLVLDSFGGSGTTGAVAHKMGRRWVMVELQNTAHTHIIPRLRKVIDGTDAGGITSSVGWQGGGGFRYYHLAPTLIVKDRFGQEIINPEFNAEDLVHAVCKLEGFIYAPSSNREEYWIHGRSTERDFLYVTTQHLSATQLQVISDDVGDERTLLVMCSAFDADPNGYSNLTVKKIPQAILHKCEWGKDDYSLRVSNLPMLDPSTEESLEAAGVAQGKSGSSSRRKKPAADLTSLFDADGEV